MACGDKDDLVGDPVSGNLMAPPLIDFCIDVEPETAEVTVNNEVVADGGCIDAYEGQVASVEASAEGYQDYSEQVPITGAMTHAIEMQPIEEPEE